MENPSSKCSTVYGTLYYLSSMLFCPPCMCSIRYSILHLSSVLSVLHAVLSFMLLYLLVQLCPRSAEQASGRAILWNLLLCPLNSLSLFPFFCPVCESPSLLECWPPVLLRASPRLSRKEKRFSFQANKREILADYALPVAVVTFR
jgi:hypothetical protein